MINLLQLLTITSEAIVFEHNHTPITHQDLLNDVKILTVKIAATNLSTWALCYQDSYLFTVGLLAVLACRREPVLLPNNEVGTVEKFSHVYSAVLTDLPAITATVLTDQIDTVPLAEFTATQAITLFTSGSTGEPKKICRTLAQLAAEITMLEQVFAADISDAVVYSTVAHQHVYGLLFYLLWPLCAARKIICPALKYPEQIATALIADTTLILVSSPAVLQRLSVLPMPHKRVVIFSSGGVLSKSAAESVRSIMHTDPYEVLGSTETSGVAYRQQLKHTAWQPLPNVSVSIDSATNCLKVVSPYFSHQQGFVLGDGAELYADGTFQLLGRRDRIAKIEGKRIALSEMEALLAQHPWVSEVYILPLHHNREYLGVIVVLTMAGKAQLLAHNKKFLNTTLTDFLLPYFERVLLPKKFRYVEQIPTNAQGKYVLADLQKWFTDLASDQHKYPQVLNSTQGAKPNSILIKLFIPVDTIYFRGHFPITPVLAGVVQVNWAIHYAAEYLGLDPLYFSSIPQLKFTQVILPGNTVFLQLDRQESELKFKYFSDEKIYSLGKINFDNVGAI